jgi:hypothetical protein
MKNLFFCLKLSFLRDFDNCNITKFFRGFVLLNSLIFFECTKIKVQNERKYLWFLEVFLLEFSNIFSNDFYINQAIWI